LRTVNQFTIFTIYHQTVIISISHNTRTRTYRNTGESLCTLCNEVEEPLRVRVWTHSGDLGTGTVLYLLVGLCSPALRVVPAENVDDAHEVDEATVTSATSRRGRRPAHRLHRWRRRCRLSTASTTRRSRLCACCLCRTCTLVSALWRYYTI